MGNLEATRDFTYVSDTVAGFLGIAEAVDVEGQTINLGTGREIRIADLVEQVLKLVDRAYLLEVGRITTEGRAAELAEQDFVRKAYVGL